MDGKFTNEYHRLRATIIRVASGLRQGMDDILAPYDLTQQQLNILRILRGAAPEALSVNVIRDRMLDRAPDASRLVDRLVAKGLLLKTPCLHDKRLVDITLSPTGTDLLARLDVEMHRIDALFGTLTEDEARITADLLSRVYTKPIASETLQPEQAS